MLLQIKFSFFMSDFYIFLYLTLVMISCITTGLFILKMRNVHVKYKQTFLTKDPPFKLRNELNHRNKIPL